MAYKRSDWNALIAEVNQILSSPPPDTDCEPVPEVDEVGPNTRWAKSHIRAVQEAISATCPDISWDEIPDLWKQSIEDEILEKLGQAWCDCEEDECDEDEGDGTVIAIFTSDPPRVVSPCFGDDFDESIDLCPLIHGMQVGPPGIIGRRYILRLHRVYNDGHTNQSFIRNGLVNCEGIAQCTVAIPVGVHGGGISVFCGDCEDSSCQEALANAAASIAANPASHWTNHYRIEIDTDLANCGECL